VAEADFRIQQNLINDLYNMTEEKLSRYGPRLTQPSRLASSTTTSVPTPVHAPPPEIRVEPETTHLKESQSVNTYWHPVKSQPTVPPAPAFQSVEIRPSVSSGSSRRTVSSTSTSQAARAAPPLPQAKPSPVPMPAPEPTKPQGKPLSEIEQKARANALRRQTLRKPVCWLFKTGKSTDRSRVHPPFLHLRSSGTCEFGDKCGESHDTIPYLYCRAYNDTGVCTAPRCDLNHTLFDYEKMVRDASKTPTPRPTNPESAADGTHAL